MRVALCLSGSLGEYKKAFPSIKSTIIDRFSPDIFISSWDEDPRIINTPQDIDIMYKPISLDIQSRDIISSLEDLWKKVNTKIGLESLQSFYKIWKCKNMRTDYEKLKNIRYDLVIHCQLSFSIPKYDFFQEIPEDVVEFGENKDEKSSLIFYGKPRAINAVSLIFPMLDEICASPSGATRESSSSFRSCIEYLGLKPVSIRESTAEIGETKHAIGINAGSTLSLADTPPDHSISLVDSSSLADKHCTECKAKYALIIGSIKRIKTIRCKGYKDRSVWHDHPPGYIVWYYYCECKNGKVVEDLELINCEICKNNKHMQEIMTAEEKYKKFLTILF